MYVYVSVEKLAPPFSPIELNLISFSFWQEVATGS